MASFMQALKRPFADKKALVLGTAIGALPGVNILVLGFGLAESDRLLNSRRRPLGWWQMEGIMSKTIAAFAIAAIYFLPVILVSTFFLRPFLSAAAGIIGNSGFISLALWGNSPFELFRILMGLGAELSVLVASNFSLVLPAALLGLLFYYVLPFALVNFVKKGSIAEAFNSKIVRDSFSADYFVLWVFFHIYVYILFSALAFFFFLPVLNFVLLGFVSFVSVTTAANLFTQVFMEKSRFGKR
ncbi:MAG: DUF4013 domain-containing protein [Candidatus Diapherotrites archaeon]|nr:DUF4013 domain-containing protein [Candidatus Diapherotrites archaeon]